MSRKNRFIVWTLLLLTMIAVSGCWDQVEIQERAFVMGMAIDTLPSRKLKPVQIQEPGISQRQLPQYRVTMEVPKFGQLGGGASSGGGGGGGGAQKPAWLPSTTSINLSQSITQMGIRAHRHIYLGQLRVIIISSDLARREGLRKILDFFFRYPEIQRTVPIFIANGPAKPILEVKPPEDQLASIYLESASILEKANSQFFYSTLGTLASDLFDDGNAIIGRVRAAKDEAVVGGAAIIKNWKLVSFLGEEETFGLRLLLGKISHADISFIGPNRFWYGINIYSLEKQLHPKWDEKHLQLEYRITSEGQLTERPGLKPLTTQAEIKKIEKAMEKHQKEAILAALRDLQHKKKTDALGLGQYIRGHWPKIWRKLGPHWAREFPHIKITVTVKHKLRRGGVTL